MNRLFTATLVLGLLATGAALANPGAGPGSGPGGSAASAAGSSGGGASSGTGYRSFNSSGASSEGDHGVAIVASPRPVGHDEIAAESDARTRIEAFGYVGITGLNQDGQSIWHGQAFMNGRAVNVALDTRGNVVVE